MKTRIITLAVLLLFAASVTSAFAEAWIGSAVRINGTLYSTKTLGWKAGEPSSFDGQDLDLGEISALTLGGLSLVNPGSDDPQPEMTMGFKIDGEPQPDFTLFYVGPDENNNNNRKYQTGKNVIRSYSIDISNLSYEDEHTIEVWFVYNDNLCDGTIDAPYVATFKRKAPTPLASAKDIANAMEAANNERIDVQLNGLKLYKDKCWNTLCLPFSLTTEEIAKSPLAGVVINELTESKLDAEGTLTLNFSEVKDITAGTPYIVKWESEADPVEDPIFTGVKLSEKSAGIVNGAYIFTGCFDVESLENQNYLYLGAENTLYYPKSPVKIGAFHAYFVNAKEQQAEVKAFVLNFDDDNESTGIKTISETSDHSKFSDTYFTLDGRRINDLPATPGLYIHNGKKIVIK